MSVVPSASVWRLVGSAKRECQPQRGARAVETENIQSLSAIDEIESVCWLHKDDVIARPAIERVVADAAIELIDPVTAQQDVIAILAIEPVSASATIQAIQSQAADENIVVIGGTEVSGKVRDVPAVDGVIFVTAEDGLACIGSKECCHEIRPLLPTSSDGRNTGKGERHN